MTFKSLPVLLALFILGVSSCSLFEDATDITFDVDGAPITFILPEAENANTFNFTFTSTGRPSDVVEKLDDENINQDRVKSVKLDRIGFRIATSGNTVDFGTIDHVTLTVSAPGFGTLTLSETDLTPFLGTEVSLTIDPDAELLDHLLAPNADYTLRVVTSRPVAEESHLRVTPHFKVTASPL